MCLTIIFSKIIPIMTLILMGLYTGIGSYWTHRRRRRRYNSDKNDKTDKINDDDDDDDGIRAIRTLQFVSCVLAAYTLAPLAFAHTSLSYFPSLLWTPIFAFPDYAELLKKSRNNMKSNLQELILLVVLVSTAAPVLLVPQIFSSYTPFVRFAYIPLHLHLFLLVLTIRSYAGAR